MIQGGCTHISSCVHRMCTVHDFGHHQPWSNRSPFRDDQERCQITSGELKPNSTNPSPDVNKPDSLLCVPRCIPSRVRPLLSSSCWGALHPEMHTGEVSFYKQGFAPARLRHASNEGNSGKDTSQESLCVSAQPFSVSTDRLFVVIQKKSSRSWRRKADIFLLTCLNITSAAHLKYSSTSVPTSVSVLQNL